MTSRTFDVLGIGNAIVDVLAHADDAFLDAQGLSKGAMTLIDDARAAEIYGLMAPAIECSGGSAANTAAGIASLGGKTAYIGKTRDDQLGAVFWHDIRAAGVHFETPKATDGASTARSLILVTPDAQRTMLTCLGVSGTLGTADIDEQLVRASGITYLEGYLWDPPRAKEAFRTAARIAHEAGREVALTLSDPFCVDRHRDSFLELIEGHIDIVFGNEAELVALYQATSFDEALQHVRGHCRVAALTRSEKGSVILGNGEVHVIDAEPVDQVIDTTGAGDLFAAGFLHGLSRGLGLGQSGRIGSIAAAEVIAHVGARPEVSLAQRVTEKLGPQSERAGDTS